MRRLGWVLAVGGLMGFLACAPAGGAGGGAAGTAPAAAGGTSAAPAPTAVPELRRISVPLSAISGTMAPLWVAHDYGIFQRHGLEVEMTGMAPASASQALASATVPVAAIGGSGVTAWVGGATELVFIAGVNNRALWKIIGRPEIQRLDDLRGRRVGSSTAGSGATLALFETLRRFGIEPTRDVEMVYLREQPPILAGIGTGAVEAGVLASPFTERAVVEGLRVLVDMRELNIPALAINIATTRGTVERDPDLLRRFLMAYIDGIQYARDQRDPTIESILRGSRTDNREDAVVAWELYRTVWDPWPSEAAITSVLENMDPPATHVRPAEMLDLRFLQELERSGWLAQHLRPL